jgi:hypothetical protein
LTFRIPFIHTEWLMWWYRTAKRTNIPDRKERHTSPCSNKTTTRDLNAMVPQTSFRK